MKRGLKAVEFVYQNICTVRDARITPMKRGLKEQFYAVKVDANGDARITPMKRGLKDDWREQYDEKAIEDARITPMKRGLKVQEARAEFEVEKMMQGLPR